MGRKEKEEEREVNEKGLMSRKYLKRCVLVAKRGANCTTPPPKWRLKDTNTNEDQVNKALTEFLSLETLSSSPTRVSARKLCATLWDSETHKNPFPKMDKKPLKSRRRRHKSNDPPKNSDNLSDGNRQDQPESATSFDRTVSASLIQHRRSMNKNEDRSLQPILTTDFRSSTMELTPYKHPSTPTSSVDLSLKTSTELIKVLNRICSLEEQNTSNASLVIALRSELDRSRRKIKELLLENESERREMNELLKKAANEKHDRMRSVICSLRNELEEERNLRKRSESLHRKLSQEISEIKSSFSNALKELERERKARILLENLCDEFAKGISEYEHEVRAMKFKVENELVGLDQHDRLILHISEAWLDERIQMKLAEEESNVAGKSTIVDKLGFDIATFLREKQRRYSLESFALNENVSAPRNPAEEDSSDVDSHCLRSDSTRKNVASKEGLVRATSCRDDEKEVEKFEGLFRNRSLSMEGSKTGNASPIQPRISMLTKPGFENSESSSRWPRDLDENTLMAQLIEARLEKGGRFRRNGLKVSS